MNKKCVYYGYIIKSTKDKVENEEVCIIMKTDCNKCERFEERKSNVNELVVFNEWEEGKETYILLTTKEFADKFNKLVEGVANGKKESVSD